VAELAAHALVDRLRVVAGAPEPLERMRRVSQARWLSKLTRGRAATDLPELLAALFSLCGEQHRITAQRALDAAQRMPRDADLMKREAQEKRYLRATCLRDQLLRISLDWPRLVPANDGHIRPGELLGLPGVPRLTGPGLTPAERATALTHALQRLVAFAEQRVLGMSAEEWSRRYAACSVAGVQTWAYAMQHSLEAAAWLARVQAQASSLALRLPRAAILDDPGHGLPLLAAALRSDPRFAEHPALCGASLESGSFNRAAWPVEQRTGEHAFGLLAARVVDVVQLCRSQPWLESGSLPLGPGEAIAYTELARGLLVHWVQLSLPELRAGRAVVEDYRILTPTDFALHPQGALATRLRQPDLTPSTVQLLVAAFDPCLEVELATDATTRPRDA